MHFEPTESQLSLFQTLHIVYQSTILALFHENYWQYMKITLERVEMEMKFANCTAMMKTFI